MAWTAMADMHDMLNMLACFWRQKAPSTNRSWMLIRHRECPVYVFLPLLMPTTLPPLPPEPSQSHTYTL